MAGELKAALDGLRDALQVALPGRLVTRSFVPHDQRPLAELEQGVVTIVCCQERDYANTLGREAMLGKVDLVLLGQLCLPENSPGQAVEDAEIALLDEIKVWVKEGPGQPMVALDLSSATFSRQVSAPFGWLAVDAVLWP